MMIRLSKKIRDVFISSFNNEDAKNSADYRCSLLMIFSWFQKELPIHLTKKILINLSEIEELL